MLVVHQDCRVDCRVRLISTSPRFFISTVCRNRQDTIEALDIAAQGKVKCQYELKGLKDINK